MDRKSPPKKGSWTRFHATLGMGSDPRGWLVCWEVPKVTAETGILKGVLSIDRVEKHLPWNRPLLKRKRLRGRVRDVSGTGGHVADHFPACSAVGDTTTAHWLSEMPVVNIRTHRALSITDLGLTYLGGRDFRPFGSFAGRLCGRRRTPGHLRKWLGCACAR